jgi:hypothetical protein
LKTFTFSIRDVGTEVQLELTNATDVTLKSVEVLTIFLKDEVTPGGGPSQAHIRFDPISTLRPNENVLLSHKTWINGKRAPAKDDQLARLKTEDGKIKPYVLDISWEDVDGKTRFERIPVGH